MKIRNSIRHLIPVLCLFQVGDLVAQDQPHVYSVTNDFEGNKPGSPQKILVLPVVGSEYPGYDVTNRKWDFPGSPWEGERQKLLDRYGIAEDFWLEASYGQMRLETHVPNCLYRISDALKLDPNGGNPPTFLRGNPTTFPFSVTTQWGTLGKPTKTIFGPRLVIKYQADPTGGEKAVTFNFNSNTVYNTLDDAIAAMNSQLGSHATFLKITKDGNNGREKDFGPRVRFEIPGEYSLPGSYIKVDYLNSDQATRSILGLTKPTILPVSGTTKVVVYTDGAEIPGTIYKEVLNIPPTPEVAQVVFTFSDGMSEVTSKWTLTCVGDNAFACKYDNASGLSQYLKPADPGNSIGALDLPLFQEFAFEIDLGVAGFKPTDLDVSILFTPDPESYESERQERMWGLASVENFTANNKAMTGLLRNISATIQAFIDAEIENPNSCFAQEIVSIPLPPPPTIPIDASEAMKNAYRCSTFFSQYSAIHGFVPDDDSFVWPTAYRITSKPTVNGVGGHLSILSRVSLMDLSKNAGDIIAHEVGHHFGFPDLYGSGGLDYHPDLLYHGPWDVMGQNGPLPHPGLFIKEHKHQWVSKHGSLQQHDPGKSETLYLITPLEYSQSEYDQFVSYPNATKAKGIILPVGGRDAHRTTHPHFIGIENRQSGALFSQNLPSGGGIHVSTNVASLALGQFIDPIVRRYSHPLTAMPFSGTPPPVTGTLDLITAFPSYTGITISIADDLEPNGIVAGPSGAPNSPSILVRVNYQDVDQVDLRLAPRAPGVFASTAIWVTPGGTGATPPADPEIPGEAISGDAPVWVAGYNPASQPAGTPPLNWIHVLVENVGSLDVQDVQVRVTSNKAATMGDAGKWDKVGDSGLKDISAGDSAIFSIPWSPSEEGHASLSAQIISWSSSGQPALADANLQDNIVHENIQTVEMMSASPWQDMTFQFEMRNDLGKTLDIRFEPENLPAGYSVTLSSEVITLAANSSQKITGKLHWNSQMIGIPGNQDPNDSFWRSCFDGSPTPGKHCGGTWNISAYAYMGDDWELIGGVSYKTSGRPTAGLSHGISIDGNNLVTVTGAVSPGVSGQPVRILVKYATGRVDVIDIETESGGNYEAVFPAKQAGRISIQVQLPQGGFFVPKTSSAGTVTACIKEYGG